VTIDRKVAEEWPYPKATYEQMRKDWAKARKEREEFRNKLIEIEERLEGTISIPRYLAESWLKQENAVRGYDEAFIDALRSALEVKNG